MPSTTQSKIINAPIEDVWQKLDDFHDMTWAAGILPSCEKTGDIDGHEVGATRLLNGAFQETLREIDPQKYFLKYSIDDGPSPVSKNEVSNYFGTVFLSPAERGGTLVEWNSSWESSSEDAVDFCHGIYVALLNELAAAFE
jgi:hypothetical protein